MPNGKRSIVFIAYLAITSGLGLLIYLLRRSRMANFILMLFSVALCLTCLETYYRFFFAESDGLGQLSRNFAARYYHYDQNGLRDSHLPLSETQKNLVIVGDSFVFGAGVKSTDDRFSNILARRYPNLHIATIALPGWDTKTETTQVAKYLGDTHASVPLIILTYFFNDIEEDVTSADRARLIPSVPETKPSLGDKLLQWLSRQSRFIELFYYRFRFPHLIRPRLEQILMFYRDPEILARHLKTLEEFRSTVSDRYGARMVMILLPYLHNDKLLQDRPFYEQFRRLLEQDRFDVIDMQPAFANYKSKQLQVNRFDPHTNVLANQLIADAVIGYLSAHPEKLK